MKIILKARVNHKPCSINEAYYLRGKKVKSAKYKAYQEAWGNELVDYPLTISKDSKLRIDYTFGFSNRASDVDNPIKTTQDTLQNFYDFNDKQVYHVRATKKLV